MTEKGLDAPVIGDLSWSEKSFLFGLALGKLVRELCASFLEKTTATTTTFTKTKMMTMIMMKTTTSSTLNGEDHRTDMPSGWTFHLDLIVMANPWIGDASLSEDIAP